MTEPTPHIITANGHSEQPGPSGRASRLRKDIAWVAVPVAAGVIAGFLWWVLAPGGGNVLSGNSELANPSNPESWLPRDLTLAALMVLAGCIAGLAMDGKLDAPGAGRRFGFAVVGGAAGALAAWGAGLLAALLWGPAPDPALGAEYGFTLRSYAVLLLWPAATAFVTFALALFGVLSRKPVK
jgi:hypothetical protein